MSNACRSGCPTQDHDSWGACARAARFQIGDIRGRQTNRAWDYELDRFEGAVRQGIMPKTTQLRDTVAAEKFADATGVGDPFGGLAVG